MAFCKIAHTTYIFPTELNLIFRFFSKSKNLKELMISPKIHSTETLTALIDSLNACMSGVSLAFVKGLCKWTRRGYAGSPYRHIGWPFLENAYCSRFWSRPESPSMPASCLLPSENKNDFFITKMLITNTSKAYTNKIEECVSIHIIK